VVAVAREGRLAGFRWGFIGGAILLLAALAVVARMREINLRSTVTASPPPAR